MARQCNTEAPAVKKRFWGFVILPELSANGENPFTRPSQKLINANRKNVRRAHQNPPLFFASAVKRRLCPTGSCHIALFAFSLEGHFRTYTFELNQVYCPPVENSQQLVLGGVQKSQSLRRHLDEFGGKNHA